MTTLNAKALASLDKEALVGLLVEALAQEPVTEPEEAVCGFPYVTKEGTCNRTPKEGDRCGYHKGKTLPEPEGKTEGNTFYEEVIVGKAEQRKTRKATNRALAEAIRKAGKVPNGDVWDAAKYLVEEEGLSFEEAAELA